MAIPIIGDLIKGAFDKVGGIVSEVVVDKDKRNQIQADLERLRIETADKAEQRVHEQMIGQMEINKVEAASTSTLVAGWRPAIGWIGATGIAYSFILEPIASWSARVVWGYAGSFPSVNYAELMVLVMGMLGIGTMRTFEKVKGVVDVEPDQPPASRPATPLMAPVEATPEDAPWQR